MKVALVTGASRGIGKAIAEQLADNGYVVYAGHRHSSEAYSSNLRFVQLDVDNAISIQNALSRIEREVGTLDLLVNNAATSKESVTHGHPEKVSKLESLDRDMLIEMFAVNSVSPIMVAKAAVPVMTRPESLILNISSIRALISNNKDGAGSYGYSAAKSALNMLTLCLAQDVPNNIRVCAAHPGNVLTDMNPFGTMSPLQSAQSLIGLLDDWSAIPQGGFINYDGTMLLA